jgi:hypothetical protein
MEPGACNCALPLNGPIWIPWWWRDPAHVIAPRRCSEEPNEPRDVIGNTEQSEAKRFPQGLPGSSGSGTFRF